MTILVLTDCPPRLRGDLSKWLMEINTGVYVGNLNPRVRDALWERVCENTKNGRATMVYRANNEQQMNFCVHNTTWKPVDYDGLTLMRRPLPRTCENGGRPLPILKEGFSNAAHQQRARQMSRRKPAVQTYAVIDVETNGLSPFDADIIEIAALYVENNVPVREFSQLIRVGQPLQPEIVRLTGITDADLQEKGQPLERVLTNLRAFIGDAVLVSHNASFDQKFLIAACNRVKQPVFHNRFIDTLALARRKIMDAPNYKLATLATHMGIHVEHPHRALADCHMAHGLFVKLNEN